MKIRPANVNGAPGFCVDLGKRDGIRRRKYFLDREAAEKALRVAEKAASEVGRRWADLPPVKRADVVAILLEVESQGLTLRQVWDAYQTGATASPAPTKPLREAINELIRAKAGANRRPVYLASLEQYLRRFAQGREAKPVAAVTLDEVEGFVNGMKSPSSRATTLNRLSTLFSFAARRGWCASNPCDRMDRPHVESGIPQILTVEEARNVLNFTRKKMKRFLPWLTLALFAGVRPEEADRLTWDAVDLNRGLLTLDAPGSKVRARRIVHLKPTAIAWLKLGGPLPLPRMTRIRCLRWLRDHLGWPAWKKDVLRHSAASYWLASDPDAGRVALELGNSPGILLKHYRELVGDKEATSFWALTPAACKK
jgi:integrase/recombinase XerD